MIKLGDTLPDVPLRHLVGESIEEVNLNDRIKGKKVILFAVSGAFTPTCSHIHLPSFVNQAYALKSKGIDEIFCVSVNDPYVLFLWEKITHATGKITLLSDGHGDFSKAIGMLDDNEVFGIRSKRYVAILDDGVITTLQVEPDANVCTITCAEDMIKLL